MVLNPAWFNALVDDDGSGNTGTVWNKPTIKGLTDAIDAEINRLNYIQNTYSPSVRSAGGGTPSYSARSGVYAVTSKLCWVGFSLTFTRGSLGGGVLSISLPFTVIPIGFNFGGSTIPYFTGLSINVAAIGSYVVQGGDSMTLVYTPGGGSTGVLFLDAGHLGAGNIDLLGQVVFIAA